MTRLEVYDNGGKTIDRYTIYVWESTPEENRPTHAITTNGRPSEFWQHTDFDASVVGEGETKIAIRQLPRAAKDKLLEELEYSD